MNNINERIRFIRTSLPKKLSQEAFAKEIGLTRSELKNIEYGLTVPKDFTILQVCQKFNINEDWLRIGEGEMQTQVVCQEEIANTEALALLYVQNQDLSNVTPEGLLDMYQEAYQKIKAHRRAKRNS